MVLPSYKQPQGELACLRWQEGVNTSPDGLRLVRREREISLLGNHWCCLMGRMVAVTNLGFVLKADSLSQKCSPGICRGNGETALGSQKLPRE